MDVPKQILQLIPTTDDRSRLLTEIDLLVKSLYHTDRDRYSYVLKHDLSEDAAGILSHFLEKEATPQTKEVRLLGLKQALLKLPLLHLTLAIRPTPSGIEFFTKKARSLFAPTVILDVVLDPSILGGALVSYDGRYVDLSLSSKLDEYFAKQKFNDV